MILSSHDIYSDHNGHVYLYFRELGNVQSDFGLMSQQIATQVENEVGKLHADKKKLTQALKESQEECEQVSKQDRRLARITYDTIIKLCISFL